MPVAEPFPQTEGYAEFVEEHEEKLKTFIGLRVDVRTRRFLSENMNFVEESGHVGHWVEVRHVEALKGGDKPESIRKEARQFQILNTVCDAANATFYQLYGDGYGSEAEIGSCSKKGLEMAFMMLGSSDAMMEPQQDHFDDMIDAHILRIEARVKQEAREAERRAKREAKLREKAAAAAEKEERARKARPMRTILLLSLMVLIFALQYS